MLNALASGQIIREPKSGTSASGTRWANTTIRCATGTDKEGAALTAFVNVVAFGDVADGLSRLTQGDSVSVQGPLRQTEYQAKDGTARNGLEIVANALLTAYQISKKRGDQGKTSSQQRQDREQHQAYDRFARGATRKPDFDDPIAF